MKINWSFDGSTALVDTDRRLRSIASNISWFTEFQPIPCSERSITELFVLKLFKLNICCHLSGSFSAFPAGVFHSYKAAMLYIAMTNTPFLNIIFQKGSIEISHFNLDYFHFELMDAELYLDVYSYRISKDDPHYISCFRNCYLFSLRTFF